SSSRFVPRWVQQRSIIVQREFERVGWERHPARNERANQHQGQEKHSIRQSRDSSEASKGRLVVACSVDVAGGEQVWQLANEWWVCFVLMPRVFRDLGLHFVPLVLTSNPRLGEIDIIEGRGN